DSNSQPARNVSVTNVTSYGQVIVEGNTNQNGLITVTGAHIGDELWAISTSGFPPIPVTNHTVTAADCLGVSILSNTSQQPSASVLTVMTTPPAFDLSTTLEPTSVTGQLRVRVRASTTLKAVPTISFTFNGQSQAQAAARFPSPPTMQFEPATRTYVGLVNQ